jgi:hypothetical protein
MDDSSPLEGIASLVRLSGFNVPARARFVGEAVISGCLSSVTLGLCCGMVGSTVLATGPLAPFLIGSWTGYSLGLARYWFSSKHETILIAQRYPTIMAHALFTERGLRVPPDVIEATEERVAETSSDDSSMMTLDQWIQEDGLARLSWSILAAQGCRTDVEELQRQQRQRLVEEYQEKYR